MARAEFTVQARIRRDLQYAIISEIVAVWDAWAPCCGAVASWPGLASQRWEGVGGGGQMGSQRVEEVGGL